jgi:membrane fusion protein
MQSLSDENLFRKQAVEAMSKRPFGRPIAVFPRPWFWMTLLIACLAVVAAGFLATAQYSRKESVRGWLVARDGVTKVSHDSAAEVIALLRAPGDSVAVGEPIIVLGRHSILDDGSDSYATQLHELQEQARTVARQAEIAQTAAAIESESVATQLELLATEQRSAAESQRRQQQRIAAASQKLSRLAIARDKGAVSDWEFMQQQDELSGLRLALIAARQQESERQRERERLQERATRLPLETERALAGLQLEQSKLQQHLARQRAVQRIVLVSPVTGKLASMAVHAGDSIAPQQLLATILPQELALTAEVYVPSSAVGFVEPGQAVRLLYDAFPYQQFGAFSGRVASVSDFVLLPDEVPKTFQLREAAFKVTIEIRQTAFKSAAGAIRLRPGMLLVADLVLETRTLASWLLAPVRWQRRAKTQDLASGWTQTVH